MLLRILHRTVYDYHGSVNMAQHMVHLTPVNTGSQTLLEHALRIHPEPAARNQTMDAFGNLRTFFSQQSPHDTLTVEAESLVETSEPLPLPDGPDWEPCPGSRFASTSGTGPRRLTTRRPSSCLRRPMCRATMRSPRLPGLPSNPTCPCWRRCVR
jgi:transglutaminase-like putative cysteine protease